MPIWWYFVLFLAGFVILLADIGCGKLFIPIWTLFVALSSAAVFVLPFGWLYAISNYQISTGSFNELMYGYMVHTPAGAAHHHPCGPSTYGAIAEDAWYRAQYMLGQYFPLKSLGAFSASLSITALFDGFSILRATT